nr:Transcription initiation factor TFIID subunit 3 [Hymenolepis microstoma]
MTDKRLVIGYVRQSAVHNRILEEERCWREHEIRKRVGSKHCCTRKSCSLFKSSTNQRRDSVEREWRRQRKKMIEESSKITAPAAAPTSALEFWRQVVRCGGDTEDRWGHDGFEELQNPGPPVPHSLERRVVSPLRIPSRSPTSPTISSLSEAKSFHRKLKDNDYGKKRVKKCKRSRDRKRKLKKSRSRSLSSSMLSSCDSDIEWIEK